MWCLWNGEYGEHDLSFVPSIENTLKRQREQYPSYIGCVVGDFTCTAVEYDWGRRDQRWTIRCNICGKESYQYHTKDWRRGKGRTMLCDCRKEAARAEKRRESERMAEERSQKISEKQKEQIGKEYGGWRVVDYTGFSSCVIECVHCGKTRKSRIEDVINGTVSPCTHRTTNDYSGDEWIGKKCGHLTVTGRNGSRFVVKCDCGRETTARPTDLFTRKTKTDCGSADCHFSEERYKTARKKHITGHEYEKEVLDMLVNSGYNATRTKSYGDFGVDIIITEDTGEKVAVQCKKQDAPAGVEAVQEVYAGGRFYDCTKFSVVCDKGFSNPAILMARKLGVYLCDGEYNPPEDVSEYALSLMPVFHGNKGLEKLYEINGEKKTLGEWCELYGTTLYLVRRKLKDGVSLETALTSKNQRTRKVYTVRGVTGTVSEICNYFGVLPQTVSYRMKHRGMSIEEAIFAAK